MQINAGGPAQAAGVASAGTGIGGDMPGDGGKEVQRGWTVIPAIPAA